MMNTISIEALLGGPEVIGRTIRTEFDLFEIGKRGLPKRALTFLVKNTNLTIRSLSRILHTTERTLQRKKEADLLSEGISEQLLQIAEVYSRGQEVFNTMDDFQIWMSSPNVALGKRVPLELLSSRFGAQMVLDEIGRIEHGVFS
ncbi:MAG: antitoxin Xre/MbcA/ParS toxin-binding domain-containing protein [Spirochaetia bacterium]